MTQASHSAAPRPISPGDHVFLVDASNFVFRAYFQSIRQDRKYNYRSDQLPTGAVRLFCTKMLQFVQEGAAGIKPTHLAIIFDKSENSFRKELYSDYKAHRPDPPEDLVPQFPLMRSAVRAFGMIAVEQDKYEADDLIATYARQAQAAGADVMIISADKDLMQLVGERVAMFDPASGDREERRIGVAEVIGYFGVPPEKVVDVQSLAGDASDNVPGAPGIGIKTAAQLITEYGDLDNLLARAGEIKQNKRRETLTDPDVVRKVKVSRELVRLVTDVALAVPLADLSLVAPEGRELVAFLKAMEFTTLTRRVAEMYGVDASEIEADPAFGGSKGWRGRNGEFAARPEAPAAQVLAAEGLAAEVLAAKPVTVALTPAALSTARLAAAKGAKIDHAAYVTLTEMAELDRWIGEARVAGMLCIDTETSSLDPMQAELVGIALAIAPGKAAYIPLAHRSDGGGDLFGGNALAPGQLPAREVLARLKPLLEDACVLKIAQNMKFDWLVLAEHGVFVAPCDDTMLMSYVLDAGVNGHGMDEMSQKYLGHSRSSLVKWRARAKASSVLPACRLTKPASIRPRMPT